MNKLEGVVRPFAAGDVFTAKPLAPVQPNFVAKPDIVVTFGNPIQLQAKPIGITNLFGGVKLSEISRTTSKKRVFNPDDNSQFVDVLRIETLKMQDANNQTHEFTFNNPA